MQNVLIYIQYKYIFEYSESILVRKEKYHCQIQNMCRSHKIINGHIYDTRNIFMENWKFVRQKV